MVLSGLCKEWGKFFFSLTFVISPLLLASLLSPIPILVIYLFFFRPKYDQPQHPTMVTKDVNGSPFTNIVSVSAGIFFLFLFFFSSVIYFWQFELTLNIIGGTYSAAVNKAGTVFVWGNVAGGIGGNGNTSLSEQYLSFPLTYPFSLFPFLFSFSLIPSPLPLFYTLYLCYLSR